MCAFIKLCHTDRWMRRILKQKFTVYSLQTRSRSFHDKTTHLYVSLSPEKIRPNVEILRKVWIGQIVQIMVHIEPWGCCGYFNKWHSLKWGSLNTGKIKKMNCATFCERCFTSSWNLRHFLLMYLYFFVSHDNFRRFS